MSVGSPSVDDESRDAEDSPVPVVGIGASAGGIQVLQEFFEALPEETGMSFVVIVNLDPEGESRLAELLQSKTHMPVSQVRKSVSLKPNRVYVIPPNKRLEVTGQQLTLSDFEEPRGHRVPVDYFFRSLAQREGKRIGIILSGGGSDGAVGLKDIKKAGGLVLVQDPEEAEHDSMPRSAISTGLVDLVLSVGEMARRLPVLLRLTTELPDDPEALSEEQSERLRRVLNLLRTETGHDFTHYKHSTVLRRVKRRMQITQNETLEGYLSDLQNEDEEAEALFKELLIGVTNFFRDPGSFDVLEERVIPQIFEEKGPTDSVRVWVVGCSTGEEAYSVAMLLEEQVEHPEEAPKIQIFASDIDEEGLATARDARYPRSIEADVSEEHLERFFEAEEDHYRVKQHLQDRIVFAPHSVLRDPPFSQIDLITCRNLLIYLRPEAQRHAFEVFHYALRGQGYLFLGEAETAEASRLFRPVDSGHCIYQAREHTGDRPLLPSLMRKSLSTGSLTESAAAKGFPEAPPPEQGALPARGTEAAAHREVLEEHAPPSALVDEQYGVVHLSERAGRYLQHPGGTITSRITRLARPALRAELRSALYLAFEEGKPTVAHPVEVQFNGHPRVVYLTVRPTEGAEGGPLALVTFNEGPAVEKTKEAEGVNGEHPAEGQAVVQNDESQTVRRLEEELERTRGQLRTLQEEYESSREELVAQNEELRSINEEYKAATEELETSKKELQSANEELEELNKALEEQLEEVSKANSDLKNFMSATDVGLLFLGRELRIRRFTPQVQDYFNIRTSDVGRPIGEITHHFEYDQLEKDALEVLEGLRPVEQKVQGSDGGCFLVRFYPYRTVEDKIDGVVVSFIDVTELEEARQKIRELSSQLTRAEQKERRRVARQLHDGLQQKLYGIQLQVSSLRKNARDLAERRSGELDEEEGVVAMLAAEIEEVEERVDEVVRSMRKISIGMSPPILRSDGLKASLEWLRTQMEELYGLSVELTAEKEFALDDDDLQVLLFRVAREMLMNVVQHADVDRATVELKEDAGRLVLRVSDQGEGFDPDAVDPIGPGKAFGLTAARERVRQFGGDLEIETALKEGTQVTIRLPGQ